MLKVLECKDKELVNIEFDRYVPLNIEFGSWNVSEESTIYWRIGDFKKSLIEIGIGKNKGELRSITLTLAENVYKLDNLKNENLKVVEGMPKIQVDNFENETYIDEKGDIKVYIGSDTVCIVFSENEVISFIKNYNIEFGIDSNEMISRIIVKNVKNSEKDILADALV
ncbi:hypothetical protein AB2T14_001835 [Clostridium botulinum]